MRRFVVLLTVAAVMAAMMIVTAVPAIAQDDYAFTATGENNSSPCGDLPPGYTCDSPVSPAPDPCLTGVYDCEIYGLPASYWW